MSLLARRQERRFHAIAMSALALIVVAAISARGSAQGATGAGAPPGGYQGGSGGSGMGGGGAGSGMGTQMQGNVQGGGMNNNQVQMTVTALTAGINLTTAQQNSVNSIRGNYAPQIQNAQQTNNTQLVQQLVQQRTAALRNILTPAQQSTFDNNVQTIRANMNSNQGNGVQY